MRNILALSALVFFPLFAYAQGLVPCGGPGQDECQACHLVLLAQNGLELLVSISAGIAVIAIAWGGLLLATSSANESQRSKARSIFTNVGIGFIIVLASWLIVDTVMKTFVPGGILTSDNFVLGPWNKISCVQLPMYQETAMDELAAGQSITAGGDPGEPGLISSEAAARLQAAGIDIKPGASVNGLKPHVIDQVVQLNQACGCNVLITEGTGGTHAQGTYSHSNGYKLDLRTRDNPALVNYVESLPSGGSWSDGTLLYTDVGSCATYAVESDHIDVQYLPSCQ